MRQKARVFVPVRRRLCCLLGPLLLWLLLAGTPPAAAAAPDLAELATRFAEPLVATAPTDPAEDAALAEAITAWQQAGTVDDLTPLERFLAAHPASPWRLALLTNLGLSYYHYGYFGKAIDAYQRAWDAGKDAADPPAKALADRAVGELLEMHARLGHTEALAALLAVVHDRPLSGPATELRAGAREGLWTMRHDPGVAYLCGPMALKNLLLARGAAPADVAFLDAVRSGPGGVTLAEVGRLADQAKLAHRLIHRDPGGPVPVPSIVHWQVDHYAAIIGERDGRYQISDPTFGEQSLWVTQAALEAEGSGYFLVPGAATAPGWREATAAEAGKVHGMGVVNGKKKKKPTKKTPKTKKPKKKCPLCDYNFNEFATGVTLLDTPVGYTPPIGPDMPVEISYDQRDAAQPANFGYFNIGAKWTLNWLSYIVDDPTLPGASVSDYAAGGGGTDYTGFDPASNSFPPDIYDASVLTLVSTKPVTYERRLQDGSIEVYSHANGATSYPRLVFLSKIIDPSGNAVELSYDKRQRLTAVVDATKRSTTFSYGLSKFPLLVTQITDPFGRHADLAYDASGRLSQITDVIGLTSKFSYDSASMVDALTTPYGTTTFAYGDDDSDTAATTFVQATDPLGQTERVEWTQGAPNIPFSDAAVPPGIVAPFNEFLNDRDTFYWDKHAYALAISGSSEDYTKARIRHWAHLASNTNSATDTLESVKYPLEQRIWNNYPGQPNNGLGTGVSGTYNEPTNIARLLDDGSQQLTQVQYNGFGNVTQVIDPVGRTTTYQYASNQIDVTAVQQATASGPVTTARLTYNAHHQPLTATDAAGKTTRYAYNAAGEVTEVTDALGHVTKYNYNPLGYLTSIINANGKTQASFTYTKTGQIATFTDSEGWTVGYSYDAADRLTEERYPDGTARTYTYDKLDLVAITDREGHTTRYGYDAVDDLVSQTDPLGHVTTYTYYENGALKSQTDPDGHTTTWAIDLQGRVTAKQYADGRMFGYGYEHSTSRPLFVSDPLQQIKQFSYTPDDRPARIGYLNAVHPTPGVSFTYDKYFPRLAAMTDGSGTTSYSYYPPGQLGALQLSGEQAPFANTAMTFSYDALGRMVRRSVAGDAETFAYDAIGRQVAHSDDLGSFTLSYLGQTDQITGQGNGHVATSWSYAPNQDDRRLAAIGNGTGASAYSFTTTAEDFTTGIADAFNKQNWTFHYDAADRLLGATATGGAGASYAYTPDPAGNLSRIQRGKSVTAITSNSVNQIVRANAAGFAYDANGNLTRDATRSYTWDAENRLIGIGYLAHPSWQTSFRYDGLGRRIAIVNQTGATATETRYLWCDEALCQARTSKDVVSKRYFPEGETTPASNLKLYYATDQLGSVRDALEAGTGAHVAHYDYEPFGAQSNAAQTTTTDFGYAGLFRERQSGLYLATYRAYDPLLGRWLSRDPIEEDGGDNLYEYADADPMDYVDDLGLKCPSKKKPKQPKKKKPVSKNHQKPKKKQVTQKDLDDFKKRNEELRRREEEDAWRERQRFFDRFKNPDGSYGGLPAYFQPGVQRAVDDATRNLFGPQNYGQ